MKKIEIVGNDSTRYIIPITSVSSIVLNGSNGITFNFVPDVWQDCGCRSLGFVMPRSNAKKIIRKFKRLGGNVPIYIRN